MNYRFHPNAFDEHHDSVAYYQSRLPGLGADYIAETPACTRRLPILKFAGLDKAFPVSCHVSRRGHTNRHFGHCSPTPARALLGWQDWSMMRLNKTQAIAANVVGILKA